jgi:Skp family chaperone for outer membrane proteins
MKKLLIPALLAGAMLATAPQAMAQRNAPAAATTGGVRVAGIGIADLEAVIASADAQRTAAQQRPVTYKAQIDAYNARATAVQNQLKPLVEKFQRDQQAANPNQASLQSQAASIQQIQESAQRELNQIVQPVAYSEAYVNEQIEEKLDQAVRAAMTASKVTLLLRPDAVLATENAYNMSPAILAELNKLIPSAQLVPPQGWEPRQIREARAAQAGQQGAQAAPAQPAGPQPEGR